MHGPIRCRDRATNESARPTRPHPTYHETRDMSEEQERVEELRNQGVGDEIAEDHVAFEVAMGITIPVETGWDRFAPKFEEF